MSEKQLSLFEFHFHDAVQFGPRTIPGLGSGDDEEATDVAPNSLAGDDETAAVEETGSGGDGDGDDGDDSGPCLLCRLVGLGVLAAAAYAVRKLLDGERGGLDALDDIEEGLPDDAAEESPEPGDGVSIEVTSGEGVGSSAGRSGLAAAAVVALLVVLAFVARKLLDDAVEDIELPDELAADEFADSE